LGKAFVGARLFLVGKVTEKMIAAYIEHQQRARQKFNYLKNQSIQVTGKDVNALVLPLVTLKKIETPKNPVINQKP